MTRAVTWSLLVVLGCSDPPPPAPATARENPFEIAFGDCTEPSYMFVSGPRPLPHDSQPYDDWTAAKTIDLDEGKIAEHERARDDGVILAPHPAVASDYVPGEHNPFRARADALRECARRSGKRGGVFEINLEYNDDHALEEIHTDGIEGEAFAACTAAVARTLPPPPADMVGQTCAFSFGRIAARDAVGIDIDGSSIAFAGTRVSIDALADAVIARRKAVRQKRTLVLFGPLVVRATRATPIATVMRVLATVAAAGDDAVLAAPRDGAWHLLGTPPLPVVPVPVETGGTWTRWRSSAGSPLVLHVAATAIQLGGTPVTARGLLAALAARKAAGVTNLTITADADVPYGDVAALVPLVTSAGFPDWLLADAR